MADSLLNPAPRPAPVTWPGRAAWQAGCTLLVLVLVVLFARIFFAHTASESSHRGAAASVVAGLTTLWCLVGSARERQAILRRGQSL